MTRTCLTVISECGHDLRLALLTRGMRAQHGHGHGPAWRLRLRWLTQLSLPRRFPIVQFPNAPLLAALIAGAIAGHLGEPGQAWARSISSLAMGVWAYEELRSGVNWFRRLLGLVFLAVVIMNIAHSIHR